MTFALALVVLALGANEPPEQTAARGATASTETYASADLDADGHLRIRTSGGRVIVVSKASASKAGEVFGPQTGFGRPVLSDDGRAVGATALFANCCTSYDIPLQLVIHSAGKTHRFEGGLAIFDWHFADGGRRVVFSQQTVHSSCGVHWELRDIASERLLDTVDIPVECGMTGARSAPKVPRWVTGSVSGFK